MLDAHFRWKCKNIRFTTGLCLKFSSGIGAKTVSINKGASGISMKAEMFAAPEDTDGAALNRLVAEMTMKMLQGDERGYEEAADRFSRAFCAASVLYFPSPNDSDMPKMEKGYIDGAEKMFFTFSPIQLRQGCFIPVSAPVLCECIQRSCLPGCPVQSL